MPDNNQTYATPLQHETERDVLRDALALHGDHEGPTPRDVLGIVIRMTCARNGLPRPNLDFWPPAELSGLYMDSTCP